MTKYEVRVITKQRYTIIVDATEYKNNKEKWVEAFK